MSFENISYFGLYPHEYGQYENPDSDFNVEKRHNVNKLKNQLADI